MSDPSRRGLVSVMVVEWKERRSGKSQTKWEVPGGCQVDTTAEWHRLATIASCQLWQQMGEGTGGWLLLLSLQIGAMLKINMGIEQRHQIAPDVSVERYRHLQRHERDPIQDPRTRGTPMSPCLDTQPVFTSSEECCRTMAMLSVPCMVGCTWYHRDTPSKRTQPGEGEGEGQNSSEIYKYQLLGLTASPLMLIHGMTAATSHLGTQLQLLYDRQAPISHNPPQK